ncbi:MAG: PAS domain S-box protein [Deltaproteobacteria bacterium]|nr:PAS domain S-box protein [Deltaproteobacteria bacterium]
MNVMIRVLVVDDSDDDAELIIRQLRNGGYDPKWKKVDTAAAMESALDLEEWDVILCDYKMPHFSAPAALKLAQDKNIDLPFIIVSGAIGEDTAVASMKSGAHDYLMKSNLSKLVVAIEREIREAKMRQEKKKADEMLKKSEENFRHSLDDSPLGIRIVTADGQTIYANQEILDIYGFDSIEEMKKTPHQKKYTPECYAEYKIRKEKRLRGEYVPPVYELSILRKNGDIRYLEVFRKQVLWNGEILFQALYNDITKRKLAEKALRDNEERYRLVVENAHEAIIITQDLKVVFANSAAVKNIGYSLKTLTSGTFTSFIHPDDRRMVADYHLKRLKGENLPNVYSFRIISQDGTVKWVELNAALIKWEKKPATLNFLNEITERKQLEEERIDGYNRIKKTLEATVHSIALLVETKDPYTSGHQLRVSELAQAIAAEMGLTEDQRTFISTAAFIHDLGKISIPSEILSKPTRLTDLEFSLIKTHSQSGYNILKDIDFPWPVANVVLQHHERMDGSGYPQNLKGDAILMESRILAVADVVEAISSHRPYRASLGVSFALDEISKNKGILYDTNVVDACLTLFQKRNFTFS